MRVAVADTHVALWYLKAYDDRFSKKALSFLRIAEDSGAGIVISSISLAEMVYLVDKGRIEKDAFDDLVQALADPQHFFQEEPVSASVALAMRAVERAQVPDMPDRTIAGTAVHLGLPLITRDGRIRTSSVETIW